MLHNPRPQRPLTVLLFAFLTAFSISAVQTDDTNLTPLTILFNNSATRAENQPVGSTVTDLFTLDQGTQYISSISEMSNCYKGEGIYFGDRADGGSMTFSLRPAYRHDIARIVVWAKQSYTADGDPIEATIKINNSQPVEIVTANRENLTGYFNIDCFIPAEDCDQITISSNGKVLLKGIYIVFDGTYDVEGNVESVTIVPSSLKIPPGKVIDLSLKPRISPLWAIDHSIVWSSSNPAVVSVTDDGVITALKAGSANITVTSVANPSAVAVCSVTVGNVAPTAVSVYPDKATIGVGGSLQYTAVVSPEEAIQDVIWSTYPATTECISVTETGLVKCHSTGTSGFGIRATSATASNIAKLVKITVVADLPIDSLGMVQEAMVLYENEQCQLAADFKPLGASNTILAWQSLNPEICSVDGNGIVTALRAGSAIVEAITTDGSDLKTTCMITVKSNTVAGMESVDESTLRISVDGGIFRVSGIEHTPQAFLYDISGKLVTSAKAIDGSVTISVPSGTVYILRLGTRSFKIAVR